MNHKSSTIPTASRRQFLRTSAATAAAVSLSGLNIGRFAHAAGSAVLRVGMIGCGGRCAGAADQALTADPGAQLVAMCDLFADRLQAKREALKTQKPKQVAVDYDHCFVGFDGYRKVIESCDVVLIANAAKFHPMHVLAAVEAGKHVFVEKPHGIDPAGIKTMDRACALAKEKKLTVVSGLQSRYHPGYQETIQRIHDGAIGEVVAIEENWLRAPYVLQERKAGMTETQFQFSTQYHFNWLSGDDVVQTLAHNLDRASWLLRDQAPAKAHGMGGRATLSGEIYGNVFDHHAVVYEFPTGVRLYAYCRTIPRCYEENSSIILGSKGRASVVACRIQGEHPWRWQDNGANPYQIEHDRLFASIRAGEALNNGGYMTRSTLIAIMGQISCYTGKEVTWEQITGSNFSYAPKPEACCFEMDPPVKPGPDGVYPVNIPGVTELI